MKSTTVRNFLALSLSLLLAQTLATTAFSAGKDDLPAPVAQTNSVTADSDAMRAYLEVQAQLHATQLDLERNQQDAELAAARTSRDLTDRLQQMQKAMTDQRAQDLQSMQKSNRTILIVAGSFAVLGLFAMALTAYFQWRGMTRLTEITLAVAPTRSSGTGWELQAFEPGSGGPMESAQRLLSVIDRLEKRIMQLENPNQVTVSDAQTSEVAGQIPQLVSETAAKITLLLGKGQSLLNLDKNEEAIACFDEVIGFDQNNTDALVKKGVALERLRKLNEAIECYDKAIAADSSVTIAYLYKGGVFNRMERFDEALQCYEQALHAQESGPHT